MAITKDVKVLTRDPLKIEVTTDHTFIIDDAELAHAYLTAFVLKALTPQTILDKLTR